MKLNFPHPQHLALFQLACDLSTCSIGGGDEFWKSFQDLVEQGAQMDETLPLNFPLSTGDQLTLHLTAFELAMATWNTELRSQFLNAYGPFEEMTFPNMSVVAHTMRGQKNANIKRNHNFHQTLYTKLQCWVQSLNSSELNQLVVDVQLWDLIVYQSQYRGKCVSLYEPDSLNTLTDMARIHAKMLPMCSEKFLEDLFETSMVSRMDDLDSVGPNMILLLSAGTSDKHFNDEVCHRLFRMISPDAKPMVDNIRLALAVDPHLGVGRQARKM